MAQKLTRVASLKSGDGGGTFDAMEHRVAFLEKSFEKMDGKLDILVSEFSRFREDVSKEFSQSRLEFAQLRADVSSEFSQVRAETSKLRTDVSNDISKFRTDVSNDISKLRTDVSKDIAQLRTDVSSDITQLRQAVSEDITKLRDDVSYLKGKIETLPSGESFGELRGRVQSLPTTAKLASLLAIAVGVIAIINKWPGVVDAIFGW
ncbi:DUF1640 domain-containing protein [Phyllobacterium zundukense]|uniref:Uncharacterized protein n=1 Tax=Phyllobacterium zundukense TaxID=1867719 RepID=A0A2N9VQW1_9HYPH|nr:DUF1640 domain-containing protein [Phyllobacterium zundukense]ATU92315.1 hypothetical protein BLM14_12215 [Phyllobacterium zundukense]PIO41879.1 hypothetical protein B5P45_22660 [Phyllobacterium zundukense]